MNYFNTTMQQCQKKVLRKQFLVMRNMFFLLVVACLQIHATGYSQSKVSVNVEGMSIRETLKLIEKQTDIRFFYNNDLLFLDQKVQLDVSNRPIDDVLKQIFKDSDLGYRVFEDNMVIVSLKDQLQQGFTVTGTVTDTHGDPLPGVTVFIKGTTQGTATDANGFYTLQVPNGSATLVFTYIGFTGQELLVGDRRTINVTLSEDTRQIEEVVVIGYGTASAKKLTTSVAKIDGQKLADLPITNVADAFTGNISGVMIEQGSGAPGALPIIRVRGYGSINAGSEPLYVIDGMIVSSSEFALLNPKSVESVNVLKDAAAGAIYGSRASNGVVIITTKEGKGNARISYNTTMGYQHVERKIPVLSGPEYVAYSKKAYAASNKPEPYFSPDIADTNWQDEIFRTGFFQNHQLSAIGSSEKVNYNVTANYVGDEGILITTYQNNYSSNGNFNIKVNNKVKIGLTYNAAYIKGRATDKLGGQAHSTDGILEAAIVQFPVIPVYMPNGDYGQQFGKTWGTPVSYNGYGNPVAALKEVYNTNQYFSGIGRAFVNYEPIERLNFNLSFNGLINSGFSERYESPFLGVYGHSNDANFSNPRYRDMVANQSNYLRHARTVEGFIDYKFAFENKHNFGVTAGFSNEYNMYRSTSASAATNDRGANAQKPLDRFDNDLRPNIWGASMVLGSGSFSEVTFQSLFGRLNYDYADKYLFMASLRRDGSSKFAAGNKYGVFPAVSAAWRVMQESFMQNQRFFDDLKFRLSYGVSGNDQIGTYAWQGTAGYGNPQYIFGPDTPPVFTEYPSSIENRKLKWETNEQYNAGLDFAILNNRIEMTADFFVRNTKDMILNRPLPTENGISASMLDNIGDMTNKGIELMLTTTNVKTNQFVWTTNWIFNKVWNKATKIYANNGIIRLSSGVSNAIWIIEGEEMFQLYTYKMLGVFKTAEELNKYPKPTGNSKIGDPIIDDYNKDGVINSEDYQKTGHALPNFTFGWTNTLKYRNFDLNIVIDGSQGASKFLPSLRNQSWVSPDEGNIMKYMYDRAGEVYGAPNLDYTGNRLTQNSYYVFDASYVRIKNVTLGYQIPQSVCNRMLINALRFSFGIQNLHTFTTYPWFNPQANFYNGGAGSAQFGVDQGSYPLATSYTLGINLTF